MFKSLFKNVAFQADEMAHWIKVLATQAWQPKFGPWNPRKGERRKLAPQKSSSDTACALWPTLPPPVVTNKHSF